MEGTVGLGDAMLMCQNGNNGYNQMWNNPIWAMAFMSYMNGGFGPWGRGAGFGMGNGLTNAEIEAAKADIIRNTQAVNDAQTLSQQVRGITNGLSSLGFALNNSIKDTGAGVAKAVNDVGAGMAMGFCNTNHNIDNLKYENAKNTEYIVNSGHADTQRVLDKMCDMELNAVRAENINLRQELANARLAYSQQAQNNYLVEKLKPNNGGCLLS